MLVRNSGMVVIPVHSSAFYTVFLVNTVSAFFREIHTAKCKKRLFLIFFFHLLMFLQKTQITIPTAHSSENDGGEHS